MDCGVHLISLLYFYKGYTRNKSCNSQKNTSSYMHTVVTFSAQFSLKGFSLNTSNTINFQTKDSQLFSVSHDLC